MKILNYIIPKALQDNTFILSLEKQVNEKGELTKRQEDALRDIIGIEEDFFVWDAECNINELYDDFIELKNKLQKNRFRKTGTRNTCVRAIISIIEEKPDYRYINKALGRDYNQYSKFRYRGYR